MSRFASVIIDISLEKLDRPFTYAVPEELQSVLEEGMEVTIPFGKGNTERKGYVLAFTDSVDFPEDKIKPILKINSGAIGLEGRAMQLAAWMKKNYGGTLIAAMKTVLPVKKKTKEALYRSVCRVAAPERLEEELRHLNPLRFGARMRLYKALLSAESLPEELVREKLQVSQSALKTAEKDGLIRVESSRRYRAPLPHIQEKEHTYTLSEEQQQTLDAILAEDAKTLHKPILLHGITGSGKTEVYMELIDRKVKEGKQAIVLIPEIALTFQTLMRFYARFGERVSVMHSRLSDGERYDQYERVAKGELDIIIGPRSALFMPFSKLGIIVIDEEHENSYKSEKMPKYHAREVAEYLAARDGAMLVLGSATPSMDSYYRAMQGIYSYYPLKMRYGGAQLPRVEIADMRLELKRGNRSFFSDVLREKMTERILRGEQSILFINRRGVAGFVSCRSCGYVVQCPHCSVSMTQHRDGRMYCHYCGHTAETPKLCPECGSKYIAGFRAGTEKIEDELKKLYPSVRVSRMDADTTKNKDDYDRILSSFADGEADILVGTQMIVKGHDFPNVTLVGAIAADLSLYASDFHAAERSFQLLCQAAGRAGRGDKPGEVVIQTYQPEHFAIQCAAKQDYEAFYGEEIAYRELADFPPLCALLTLQFYSKTAEAGKERAELIAQAIKERMGEGAPQIIGPAEALIGKIRDIYRTGLYLRHPDEEVLHRAREIAEETEEEENHKAGSADVMLQIDPNPVSAF